MLHLVAGSQSEQDFYDGLLSQRWESYKFAACFLLPRPSCDTLTCAVARLGTIAFLSAAPGRRSLPAAATARVVSGHKRIWPRVQAPSLQPAGAAVLHEKTRRHGGGHAHRRLAPCVPHNTVASALGAHSWQPHAIRATPRRQPTVSPTSGGGAEHVDHPLAAGDGASSADGWHRDDGDARPAPLDARQQGVVVEQPRHG